MVITGRTINFTPSRKVMNTEKFPIVVEGTRRAMKLPTTVNARTLTIMISPFLISRFLFLWYVYAETALASTSEESAMPTAIYGSMPRNVMSIGLMTAAALIPAKPVPSPAPTPAKNVTIIVVSKLILLCLPFCFPYDFKGRIIIKLYRHMNIKSMSS